MVDFRSNLLDTRMQAIGGTVVRQDRLEVEGAQTLREIERWNTEMDRLDAELARHVVVPAVERLLTALGLSAREAATIARRVAT